MKIAGRNKNKPDHWALGMTPKQELNFFEEYARSIYTGRGEIVDLGCWLGSTAIALAKGLKKNKRAKQKDKKIHVFDSFQWEDYMNRYVKGTGVEGHYKHGDSFQDEFLKRTEPWAQFIKVHPGDLNTASWNGQEIELLLIDAMKSWELSNAILQIFFPALMAGTSYVIQQDFGHYYTSWIHMIHYRLRDYFKFLCPIGQTTAFVFRYEKPLPRELIEMQYDSTSFSPQEVEEAFNYSLQLTSDPLLKAGIASARIMWGLHKNDPEEARLQLDRFLSIGLPLSKQIRVVSNLVQERQIPSGTRNGADSQNVDSANAAPMPGPLRELFARISGCGPFPETQEDFATGLLLQNSIATRLDVHNNPFSRQRLRDFYYTYLRPHSSTRPPIKSTTWVEIGSESQNPAAFLFLILMLGAKRCIAVNPDPIQNPQLVWKALADLSGLILIDPKCVLELEECDPHDMLKNIASFDLAKLRAGDGEGMDSGRFTYLQETVESISLPDDTADVVISNAFLEHVEDLDQVADQLFRITRPGGLGIHGIDGKDHRMYSDSSVPPLAFLEIEDTNAIVEGCNRVRPFAMHIPFQRAGFELVEKEVFERIEITQQMRERFVEPFRSMPQEDLDVLSGMIVIRKPVQSVT